MPVRNTWRVGRHLIMDDIDGRVRYDDAIGWTWDGLLTRKSGRREEFFRHPQDFVKAPPPEPPPVDVRLAPATSATSVIDVDVVRGVLLPKGAAAHLFSSTEYGIGTMQIATGSADAVASGDAFLVR